MGRVISKLGIKKTIALTVLAVIAISIFAVFVNMNDNSLDFRNRDIRLIVTDSMDGEPQPYDIDTIPVDTLVMVQLLSYDEKLDLKKGDVIQFRYGNVLNHHRIVDDEHISDGYVITKGDNSSSTEHVNLDKITGKVIGKNHLLGEIFKFVKTYVFVILVLIVVLYIASMLAEQIIRDRRENND